MNLLTVKSALPGGRVALWERNSAHPNGEAFIADEQPHVVAGTPAVLGAIARNALVIVPTAAVVAVAEEAAPTPVAKASGRTKKEA